jgi:hypothetical protein
MRQSAETMGVSQEMLEAILFQSPAHAEPRWMPVD